MKRKELWLFFVLLVLQVDGDGRGGWLYEEEREREGEEMRFQRPQMYEVMCGAPRHPPTPNVFQSSCLNYSTGIRESRKFLFGPSLDGLVYGYSHIIRIVGVQARHADAAVLGHVDVRLRADPQHLLFGQPREAEHADLVRDVAPAPGLVVQLLQLGPQPRTHILDACAHLAQVGLPLGKQLLVVQHRAGDAGAIRRRVADFAALQDRELRRDARNRLRGVSSRGADKVEGPDAFAVQPKILGEGLCHAELKPFGDEVPHRPGIVLETARCETLIGAVEKGKVFFRADERGEFGPLRADEINTGRIMGAGMQHDDTARWGLLDSRTHAGEVEAVRFFREVRVSLYWEIDVGEDLVVIGPSGRGEIHRLVCRPRIEFREKEGTEMESTCT